ncbi:MAG: hypothetical protein JXB88_22800 [Spirochaetales bacterium]|nr:hypothetical protein [Spirochaetales bacterium]
MKPDRNRTVFPGTPQKSIWHTLRFISLFREIIPHKAGKDESQKIAKGEKDFYDFMTGLFLDMYEHPGNYFIPLDEYDHYMKGRTKEELPHKNDSRECTLRNKFQKSIKFYQDFLYNIGKYGKIDCTSLVIPEMKYKEIIAGLKVTKKDDNSKRIDALKTMGMNYTQSHNTLILSNNKYPMMFTGLSLLSRSPNRVYGYMCFLLCDYRGIREDFKPGFTDTLFVLDEEHKKEASEMNDLMNHIGTKLKIKPFRNTQAGSFWKLQYYKNGKAVASFHIDINTVHYFINFNNVNNISRMGYLLKDRSVELYDWFFHHIKTMNCSCKNNRKVDIGGTKKRICGLMNRMELYDPNQSDMDKMKSIVTLFHCDGLYIERKLEIRT